LYLIRIFLVFESVQLREIKIKFRFAGMKKIFGFLLVVVVMLSFSSCKESVDKKKNDLLKKYELVKEMGDYYTAAYYLQEYLFLDSSNVDLKDSLTRIFVALENVQSAEYMAKQVVEKQPLNEDMQSLLAQIDIQKGDVLTGMSRFDKLFEETKDYKYIFSKGLIYAQGQQANKTLEVVEELMAVPDNELKTIKVKKISNPNEDQAIKIKAAALFLKAYAYLGGEKPDTRKAFDLFEETFKIQNDFELARALAQQAFPPAKQ